VISPGACQIQKVRSGASCASLPVTADVAALDNQQAQNDVKEMLAFGLNLNGA
jgi:hypothetical protein